MMIGIRICRCQFNSCSGILGLWFQDVFVSLCASSFSGSGKVVLMVSLFQAVGLLW